MAAPLVLACGCSASPASTKDRTATLPAAPTSRQNRFRAAADAVGATAFRTIETAPAMPDDADRRRESSMKPRFTLAEWNVVSPYLTAIFQYGRRYSGPDDSDASDVLDGWADKADAQPLVREGLIELIRDGGCGHNFKKGTCGCGAWSKGECQVKPYTWHLTGMGRDFMRGRLPIRTNDVCGQYHDELGRLADDGGRSYG